MNIFQLKCFLSVAASLSFAQAARQMNISQPAITHQIKVLENELNTTLFRRSTRMVEITPEGQAFLADARSMVAIAEQAKMRFRGPDNAPIQMISIGCSSYGLLRSLSDSLSRLAAECPGLHPHLYVSPHDQLFRLLETDTLDIIFDIREGSQPNGKLTFQELWRCDLVGVCRPSRAAGRTSISLQALSEEPLIFCDPVMLAPEAAQLQWNLAKGRSPTDIHFSNSLDASVVLAAAGLGLAILPELFVPETDMIVKLKVEDSPQLSFGLFYKPYSGDTIAKRFAHIVKNDISGAPAAE